MNQQEVLRLAKTMGVMISGRPEFQQSVAKFGKSIASRFKPLTKTQEIYLEALTEPKSLQNLADQFGCTPQNALKMIRTLETRKLISKEKLFKRHAWSYYYQRKS
jgi:DNA-binding MarR family transcriptional regulator